MVLAIGAALAGAVCCAVAAALQHREAVSIRAAEAVGWRLLSALSRRPYWLAGVATLLVATGLHSLALLNGPLSLVQPLGVTTVVFAVPVAAMVRRYRVRVWELLAAATVVTGLCGLLAIVPSQPASAGGAGSPPTAWMLATATVLVVGVLTALASRRRVLLQGLLLATGAGIAMGVAAVLLQMVLLNAQRGGLLEVLSIASGAVVLLAVAGVWLNQRAYRAGNVAVVLAVVTVSDPAASTITAIVLGERLPTGVLSWLLLAISAATIVGGITWLARSPAHAAGVPV
ncbi:DMT family transporter [Actinocrispum sp. NPDC049592]|uniref:DMT family transporter n=1 Tax=Actinocrispum sp. NPDC049592 TaxID=3154835 RepID=UPI0034200136